MQLTLQGRLEYGVMICARTPAAGVRDLLPPGLELATHGRWAFWNIAFGRLSGVRPAGVPRGFGTSYQQVAYRLVVHARNAQGRARRGVYFVRSFADCYAAQWLGNRLTDFNIRHAGLEQHGEGDACDWSRCPRRRMRSSISASASPRAGGRRAPVSAAPTRQRSGCSASPWA